MVFELFISESERFCIEMYNNLKCAGEHCQNSLVLASKDKVTIRKIIIKNFYVVIKNN